MFKTLVILATFFFARSHTEDTNFNTTVSTCMNANWATSFKQPGWSNCSLTFPFITGFYRSQSVRTFAEDGIHLLKKAQCCQASNRFQNASLDCVDTKWKFTNNKETWNTCPTGYFLHGLKRSIEYYLDSIKQARCCTLSDHILQYGDCYRENIWKPFDKEGMVTCSRAGYFITGLYKSHCQFVFCIEQFRCCSMASCQYANWTDSFNNAGWSVCPKNSKSHFITGFSRRSTPSRSSPDHINNLEGAQCCEASKRFQNETSSCVIKKWQLRPKTWVRCRAGYFLNGLKRSDGHTLKDIESSNCCKPATHPDRYGDCYNENVWSRFDSEKKGLVTCSKAGYFIAGLYRSNCTQLYCIEAFYCCSMAVSTCKIADWWTSFDRDGESSCPVEYPYITGFYRNTAGSEEEDSITHLVGAQCCKSSHRKNSFHEENWSRTNKWKKCPPGYFLHALIRSGGSYLNNVKYAKCWRPNIYPKRYQSCYEENVESTFDYYKHGMVTCSTTGFFITGFSTSSCKILYLSCLEYFRCCSEATPYFYYERVGCFKHNGNNAIPTIEKKDPNLNDEDYKARPGAVEKCYQATRKRGFQMFAVYDGGSCLTSATAIDTFEKNGLASDCGDDGEGGPQANMVYYIKDYEALGCYEDVASDSAFHTLETKDGILDGSYKTRKNAIAKCAVVAKRAGYSMFALQDGGRCVANASGSAQKTFDKYGKSEDCKTGGKGGPSANDVYSVKDYETVGCYNKNVSDVVFQSLEKKDGMLNGSYNTRVNAIAKCAVAAKRAGYSMFALQDGGWCAASATVNRIEKYGNSEHCNTDGKGGPFANDVYLIKDYEAVGCYKDLVLDPAFQTLETKDDILDGSYKTRKNAIAKCAVAAERAGSSMFALQDGGRCAGNASAQKTFEKYGKSEDCKTGGKGGPSANDVYLVKDYEAVGCYKYVTDMAFQTLEKKDDILDGLYNTRENAIAKCAVAAKRAGYSMFALQDGGWCAASASAHKTFTKYVRSKDCNTGGKGGTSANDVYFIKAPESIFTLTTQQSHLETRESSLNSSIIAGIVIAVIFLILLVVALLYGVRRKRKRKRREQDVQSFHEMHGITDTSASQSHPLQALVHAPLTTTRDSEEEVQVQVSYVVLASDWDILRENLTIFNKKLGEGQFGIVKQGLYSHGKDNSETVAVKMLKDKTTNLEKSDLLAELDILKEVNRDSHPNVLKLIGSCTTEPVLVVTEFCPGGNLRKFLRNSRTDPPDNSPSDITLASTLTQRQLLKFAVDVANGMTYIASLKIIHRDLAARNILIGENETAKLSDFGLARNISETEQYVRNKQKLLPVKWMALESLEHGTFTTASDVWSYGVLVYEITTLGEEPYRKISPHYIVTHVGSGHRMEKPEHCPDEVYTIMRNCWKVDPDERPTFEEIHEALSAMITND